MLATAFHPELTDDSATARAVHGHHDRSAEARARGGKEVRDPRAERLAKILVGYSTKVKEGEVVAIDGDSAAEPLLLAVYEEVLKAGAQPDHERRARRASRPPTSSTRATPSWIGSPRSPSGCSRTPTSGSRSAPRPTPASSRRSRPSARPAARRRSATSSRGRWSAARRASSAGSTRCSRPTPTRPRPR